MPYVYRRPFDTAQHRQAFNHWQLIAVQEAGAASAAFSTYAASLTVTPGASEQGTRATRFSSQGFYRRRWPYAVQQSRIHLFYVDDANIGANAGSGALTAYAAAVQIGSASGASISAVLESSAFATYTSAIQGAQRNPFADALGEFEGYTAAISLTYGLGESRTGSVPARGSGNYRPARVNVKGRTGRKVSGLKELVRRK